MSSVGSRREPVRPGSAGVTGLGETGRKLSLASAAVEQHKLNDVFRRENQKAIDFLTVQNAEYLKMLEPDEELYGADAKGASAINTQAMRDTLAPFLERSALKGMRTPVVKKRMLPSVQGAARTPYNARGKQKHLLAQLSGGLPARTGVNLSTGRIEQTASRWKLQQACNKKAPKKAVTKSPVNYVSLLQEQRQQLDAAAANDVNYKAMLHRYHSIQADVGRRFSLLLAEGEDSQPGSRSNSRPSSALNNFHNTNSTFKPPLRPNTTPPGLLATPVGIKGARPGSGTTETSVGTRISEDDLPPVQQKPLSTLVGEVFEGLGARTRALTERDTNMPASVWRALQDGNDDDSDDALSDTALLDRPL